MTNRVGLENDRKVNPFNMLSHTFDKDYDFEVIEDNDSLFIPNLWLPKRRDEGDIESLMSAYDRFISHVGAISVHQLNEGAVTENKFQFPPEINTPAALDSDFTGYTRQELLREILSFKALNNNWDGFGAIPLELETTANVITLVSFIKEDMLSEVDSIFPNPNGTISLIWNNQKGSEISLEVGNNTMSYYVKLPTDSPKFFNELDINSFEADNLSKIIQLL